MTDTNPQFPFLTYLPWPLTGNQIPVNAKRYYDFDETRLVETYVHPLDNRVRAKSFTAKYCQDTFYLYLDSRSYDKPLVEYYDLGRFGNETLLPPPAPQPPANYPPLTFAFARGTPSFVRPYWSAAKNPNASGSNTAWRNVYKPVNATTFQLICAGQDGDFGFDTTADTDVKVFNTGLNYTEGDKDNITNFSGGSTLGDSIP